MVVGDSHEPEIVAEVMKDGPFDMVFIDGDHGLNGAKKDCEYYASGCKTVALHDICDEGFEGNMVPQFWEEIKTTWGDFDSKEFVLQYPDVHSGSNKNYLGIGLAIRKSKEGPQDV
jgi:hypothetical protein